MPRQSKECPRDQEPGRLALFQRRGQHYMAEVGACALDEQSRMVELLIDVMFGTLGAQRLTVRVCNAKS